MSALTVSFADVLAARERISGHVHRTPVLASRRLDALLGAHVVFKAEPFQRVGAFKARGAFSRLTLLSPGERARGVVAFSSGNHAQGVALAAKLLGIPATIVMPVDAPQVKVEGTKGYGAEIRFYDRFKDSREAIAAEIARERGSVVVPAFDDPHIIAGQGTVGLELVRQAGALGAKLDVVSAPISGGGLISGIATAVKALSPTTAIVGVEPEGFDDTLKSLQKGERVIQKPTTRSLCDALESPFPGELTFPIMRKHVADVATVSDRDVTDAMRFAFRTLKLVVEPGGAAALAALLAGKINTFGGSTVALVLSGGNVDPDQFAQVLRGEL
jgi:threonine dehydratase